MFTSFRIFVRACRQWSANRDSRLGAALAYYALFSFAPLLVIAVMIAAVVFDEQAAHGQVAEHLTDLVGPEIAVAVERLVADASRPREGWAPVVSIALLVIGSLGMFLHLRGSLCTIWKLEPPQGSGFVGILVDYALALAMVLFCGILLLASLAASMLVTIFQETLDEWMPGLSWHSLELGLSFLYLTILFAAVYQILSGGRLPLRYVSYGAVITAILFTIGKRLLGYYFVYATTASIYGAAGSLVAFLMWIYYSSQLLFFGAELIQARRTRREWMPVPPPQA
jgi:membrane protein